MKNRIAFFDFCETLANFQTGDAFVRYVVHKCPSHHSKVICIIHSFLSKIGAINMISRIFPKLSINKRIVLLMLRGHSSSVLEDYACSYYYEIVKPNLIPETVTELEKLRTDGWRIVIVSAGYEIYLKYFMKDFDLSLDDLLAVKIKFADSFCKGTIDGSDLLYGKEFHLQKKYKGLMDQTIAFSDSLSDLPLLLMVDKAIVVRKSTRESWAKKYGFNELIWA